MHTCPHFVSHCLDSSPSSLVTLGVGRLAFELTNLGYCVQGNDFSLFMLLASDFILNGGTATPEHPLRISPWLLESRNVHGPADPVRAIQIPDVDPFTVLSGGTEHGRLTPEFSMAAGEFASIYGQSREAGQWDSVVCCFFLDACPNIVEHLQLIYRMLKPGGYLVHFGPLLYHWSGPAMRPDDKSVDDYQARFSFLDKRYMASVDLCYEDIRKIMLNVGFEILEERTGLKCLYTADRRSMMNMVYHCVSLVARKATDWTPDDRDGEEQDDASGG
jgi:carnosine N-methyltransferase